MYKKNLHYEQDSVIPIFFRVGKEAQLVITQQWKAKVLEEYHNSPMAGHYGSEGTSYWTAEIYYSDVIRNDVSGYVKIGLECSRYKDYN